MSDCKMLKYLLYRIMQRVNECGNPFVGTILVMDSFYTEIALAFYTLLKNHNFYSHFVTYKFMRGRSISSCNIS